MGDDPSLAGFCFVLFAVDVDPAKCLALLDAVAEEKAGVWFESPLLDFVIVKPKPLLNIPLFIKHPLPIFKRKRISQRPPS